MVGVIGILTSSTSVQAAETTAYAYDALGRLTNTTRSGSINVNVLGNYRYDPAGNRISVSSSGVPVPPSSGKKIIVVPIAGLGPIIGN